MSCFIDSRLVVTRTIGDTVTGNCGVLHIPYVTSIALNSDLKFIILGSDGVWDGISNNGFVTLGLKPESVLNVLKRSGWKCTMKPNSESAELYAKQICDEAYIGLEKEEIDDNISAIIVFL